MDVGAGKLFLPVSAEENSIRNQFQAIIKIALCGTMKYLANALQKIQTYINSISTLVHQINFREHTEGSFT